jgi:guanosine-3',5'-bis(diphosphate) 3'-pyrophosphohydrolase
MGIYKEFTEEETLFERVRNRFHPDSVQLIEKAYHVSKDMHEGQNRLSGEPYIIHPLNVAILLEELGMDDATIAAGLLHDVVEDTKYTRDNMIRDFGDTITHLVEGVTKISQIKSNSKESEAAENIRKMLLATTRDIRVILIKLADKTHNIRTLKFQAEEKRKRIAREVLSIYAPIAGRLGIYKIKIELEDLAFQVLHPEEYQRIKANISEKKGERDEFIEKIKSTLRERMASVHLDVKVEGRAKHFYSIYKKMNQKEKSFDEILDLRAVRLIVKEMKDCYASLGIVHTIWTPVPGRFKDYIATPKTNLYQSLHTTVIGPEGKPVEVQIRTFEMNQIAENGVAAHYAYKEGKPQIADDTHPFTSKWVELLKSWQDPSLDSREFLEELQHDLHEDEVFIFTPKGEIIEMPKGSNVLDFAFRIHTDIGLHTKGAKINGKWYLSVRNYTLEIN